MIRILALTVFMLAGSLSASAQSTPLYRDANRPAEARADDLLSRMTLEEKVGQMAQINLNRLMGTSEWDAGPLNKNFLQAFLGDVGVGSVLSGGGAAPVPNTPTAWAETTDALQRYAIKNTRLGIPLLYGLDAVHGHNNVLGATLFPHNIGLAASWNPALARAQARSTAKAMRATGSRWDFAPVTDIGVDPRWGRFYETFGEDPYLTSRFVGAVVRGLQGGGLGGPESVAATVKHFVGYGAGAGGQDRAPADFSTRTLREVHLPPARAGLAAGAAAVMANSGSVNGVPVHASHALLTDLLRSELGFSGLVVSDWEDILKLQTVHRVAKDFGEAVAMSVNAGVDMYMVPNDAVGFTAALLEQVDQGTVSEARIDEAVRRILTLKFELGLFENPYTDPKQAEKLVVGADTGLARKAAAETMTLLKNDGVLPLRKKGASLFVTGPSADNLVNQLGGWSIGWQGVPDGSPLPPGVTFLAGLRAALGGGAVIYLPETDQGVTKAAEDADAAVVFVGETPYAEGEGDRQDLGLPPEQLELLRQLTETDTPTVVVMVAGRPLTLPEDLLLEIDAFVMAYLPGSQGGSALADVLLGNVNPSAKLPFSWPHDTGELPLFYNHPPGRIIYEPLFTFGYGLSYTTFGYGNLAVSSSVSGGKAPTGTLSLTAEVTNRGEVAGTEVVQVYLSRPPSGVLTPERALLAFKRVKLAPGETKTVTFNVPASQLSVLPSDISRGKIVMSGSYELSVGNQQAAFNTD